MSRLERLTHVCLISLCFISGAILLRGVLLSHDLRPKIQPNPSTALIGKKLDVPQAKWGSSRLSAVVFLSTACHFCDASMPFYRRMVTERGNNVVGEMPLLAISAEPSEVIMKHLLDNNVAFDHAYQVPFPNSILRLTPTLLFVDSSGIIRRAVIGQLTPSQENQVMAILRTKQVL